MYPIMVLMISSDMVLTYFVLVCALGEAKGMIKFMKKYFTIFIIQISIIVIIGFMLKIILKISDVEAFLIPASCFMIIFLGVQVIQSKKFFSNAVSKDGIIGARLAGIIVTSWLLPLCIGYAFINPLQLFFLLYQ